MFVLLHLMAFPSIPDFFQENGDREEEGEGKEMINDDDKDGDTRNAKRRKRNDG